MSHRHCCCSSRYYGYGTNVGGYGTNAGFGGLGGFGGLLIPLLLVGLISSNSRRRFY